VFLNRSTVFTNSALSRRGNRETESKPVRIPMIVMEIKISYKVNPPDFLSVRMWINKYLEQSQE